jgi:hypothetical protein
MKQFLSTLEGSNTWFDNFFHKDLTDLAYPGLLDIHKAKLED